MASGVDALFVTNVTFKTDRKALLKFFAQYNGGQEPIQCKLLMNGRKRFEGRLKLMLSSQEATEGLLQLSASGQLMHKGRTLRAVKWVRSSALNRSTNWIDESSRSIIQVSDDWEKEIADSIETSMKLKSCDNSKHTSNRSNKTRNCWNGEVFNLAKNSCERMCDSCRTEPNVGSSNSEAVDSIQSLCNCISAFEKLPDEILLSIFDYVSLNDLQSIEQVSVRCEAMALRKWRSLKRLKISEFGYSALNPITDKLFAELLKKMGGAALQVLDLLGGCQFLNNTSMKLVAELCPNLLEFHLISMRIGSKGIQAMSKGCRKLKVVTLNDRSGQIGEDGLWWLFHNCKELEVVDLDSNHRLKGPCMHVLGNNIRSLLLSNCTSLTDVGIKKLQEFCPMLNKLDLSNCSRLSNAGFASLSKCKSITSLDVSGDYPNASKDGLRLLSNLSALSVLTMCQNSCVNDSVVRDIARGCRQLRCVSIAQMQSWGYRSDSISHPITSVSVAELARHCPRLTTLNLNHCNGVDRESTLALARYCAELKTLRMRECRLDAEGLNELIQKCRKLEFLDIMYCIEVGKSIVATAIQGLSDQPTRRLEMQLGATGIMKDNTVEIPSNLVVHFDTMADLRMDDDDMIYAENESEEDGEYEGFMPAGAEDDYYDDFLDNDDPLYMERFELS